MTVPEKKIYPRTGDRQTVYLNQVVHNPNIVVGDYTIYNDFVQDPTQFERNNVLYHYPVNGDRLVIGEILLHCLRREVSVEQRQSYADLGVDLSVPYLL